MEPEPMQMSSGTAMPNTSSESRRPRPFVPRIDPLAPSRSISHGELTPASSGSDSAAISPTSSGNRLLPSLKQMRKSSAPVRRPPSPELLSQDCAFPPFPTNRTKKKESQRNARERTQARESSRSRSSEHQKMWSTSAGPSRSRVRQGTAESSRPSTASSSRRPSVSSRSGSRQGSLDTVPPLPPLQPTSSHSASNSVLSTGESLRTGTSLSPAAHSPPDSSVAADRSPFPEFQEVETRNVEPDADAPAAPNTYLPSQQELTDCRTPSYRAKRPPPISDMPSRLLVETAVDSHEQSPPTPTASIARTLTSLFSRKRGTSTSSKKSTAKTPVADGPRFIALSPEPDPQDTLRIENTSHNSLTPSHESLTPSNGSMNTEMVSSPLIHDVQEAPHASVHIRPATESHPLPLEAQIAVVSDDVSETPRDVPEDVMENEPQPETSQAAQRDTLQMEQDLERRLAAMTGAPQLVVIKEDPEDMRRASLDSASSYGSIGFSHSSTSSRSFRNFEGHSHKSSISTARTTSTSEDAFMLTAGRTKHPGSTPDSPTDPYLQSNRLRPVVEISLPREKEEKDVDSYPFGEPQPTIQDVSLPLSEPNLESTAQQPPLTSPASNYDALKFEFLISPEHTPSVPPTPSSEADSLDFPFASRTRRPSTAGSRRGTCRGCSKDILTGQKSVSSRDGRLTGRYHKECFVCMTCKEAFATADFYVLNDHPYCAHHYHELNDTLCEGCGLGIEGHYLETSTVSGSGAKKFHPQCLKCATCKIQLDDDYFEHGGQVYCERDAFRVISGPRSPYGTAPSRPSPLNREYISSAEPGQGLASGRFPERRLTKLMTTT
ncbi:hypothetical protein LTS08_002651 [Lithohypha guttulata]|uniref:LIM zinc-binding domain-containing protein n=1 Tax=Lithohypha guttulata TaxID=1690604 RepID=A0AAN7Y9L2_9EURO|nr:hypothetical protein LTR05_000619 [Lithohypha guttulata]KAK5104759.1 hypothetical protein LTS08_002651 [Lithohypha guttulata]